MEAPIGRLTTAVFNYAPEQQEEMQRAFDQIAANSKKLEKSSEQLAASSEDHAAGSASFGKELVKSLDKSVKAIGTGFDGFVSSIALNSKDFSDKIEEATEDIGTEFSDTLKDGILKGEWKAPNIGGILQGLGGNLFDQLINDGIGANFGSLGGGGILGRSS